ncbi:hypothetical protein NMX13_11245 [Dickeya zeae]|nr:hypothetical protein NMX13_11245 [Dickeya zeae]
MMDDTKSLLLLSGHMMMPSDGILRVMTGVARGIKRDDGGFMARPVR